MPRAESDSRLLHDGGGVQQLHHVLVGGLGCQALLAHDALLLSGLRLGALVHLLQEGLVLRLQVLISCFSLPSSNNYGMPQPSAGGVRA